MLYPINAVIVFWLCPSIINDVLASTLKSYGGGAPVVPLMAATVPLPPVIPCAICQ